MSRRQRIFDVEDEYGSSELEPTVDPAKNDPPPRREYRKRSKRIILGRRTEDGTLEQIPPTESMWYQLYVSCPQTGDKRFETKFRRRFRVPYQSFLELVEDAYANDWFPRWTRRRREGKKQAPLELLLLGSLRYLGRGFTFDDCEECTAISEEIHRVFFHKFIELGSTTLFKTHVLTPATSEELQSHLGEFEMAGMPGTPGSSDATSIVHEMCAWRLRRIHKGGKSKHPTRTYNMTVNHRRRILGTTRGHPGSWNDKTVVLFDEFIKNIKRGNTLQDHCFELLELRGDRVVRVKYRGVWIVVDNGYHDWSTTIPPFKNTNLRNEIRWSEWLESMRKDVECAFGIMKGRFRILKSGIRLHSTESVDMIWLTCCALHNMLLEVDGLDEPWDGTKIPSSAWEGELGRLECDDVPVAMRRVLCPAQIRRYDTSYVGAEGPEEVGAHVVEEYGDETEDDGDEEEEEEVGEEAEDDGDEEDEEEEEVGEEAEDDGDDEEEEEEVGEEAEEDGEDEAVVAPPDADEDDEEARVGSTGGRSNEEMAALLKRIGPGGSTVRFEALPAGGDGEDEPPLFREDGEDEPPLFRWPSAPSARGAVEEEEEEEEEVGGEVNGEEEEEEELDREVDGEEVEEEELDREVDGEEVEVDGEEVDEEDDGEEAEVRVVNKLSQKCFRDRLVEHFNIMFRRGELRWPKRRGATPTSILTR